MRNFLKFFDLQIFRDSYFDKVVVAYCYYSYLGVVFLNYFYCECYYLVNSGLFSCTDKKINWFSMFLWFVLSIFLLLSTFRDAHISTGIVVPLFECWFTFKLLNFLVGI